MELAYRLAVDESAYIKSIRDNVITLITPVVEVDGRDRMVDIYRWHLANPGKQWPPLIYWGHYVAHDNNRDAMGLTLQLTRNVLNTFVGWKAQVLHDLHESVPYLYDNTVGDGPYNAWIDPILADEWQMMGWNNVSEMTKFGMPGVFTHGTFDTWSPSYLMFIAAMHNGISRLYETFGNGGADTEERTLRPNEYARTWFKQNPPLPKTKWSQRNNNNYEQTGVLTALALFRGQQQAVPAQFLSEGQALHREAEDRRAGGVRVSGRRSAARRAGRPAAHAAGSGLRDFARHRAVHGDDARQESARARRPRRTGREHGRPPTPPRTAAAAKPAEKPKPEPRTFPAGSYVLRMDQPYSRIADTLLDYQYWAANDPQKSIYDDTGWTFGELGNVQVSRVTDVKVLDAAMDRGSGAGAGARRRGEHGRDLPDQSQCRQRADHAALSLPERLVRRRRGAVRSGRAQVQSRLVSSCARWRPANLAKAAAELGVQAYAVATRAGGEDASGARRANRHHAHLAQHAERRLVAAGVRPPQDSLRLHQHADRGQDRRPARQVRRDRLRAGSPRQSADDCQRHADVRQSAAVEGHAAHAESGEDRRDRRHASRPRLGRARAPAGVRAQGRTADHRQRHHQFRGDVRIHAGRQHRRPPRG